MSNTSVASVAWLSVAAIFAVGCGGGKPDRVLPPEIDPTKAAATALGNYDSNGDGRIADDEFEAVPALKSALSRIDKDGDGGVSLEEIEQRIEFWAEGKLGITSLHCTVHLDGKPLDGATVIFEPEAFLGEAVQPASAKTDSYGVAAPSIDAAHLPHPNIRGAQVGFYKVRISKTAGGRELIPRRYNEATELGGEIAIGSPGVSSGFSFELSSK